MSAQREVQVVGAAAAERLDASRRQILELVRDEPDSAAGVARRLGLPRQRVNYHIRELEKAGLVEEVGTRPRRGLKERLVRATAAHYFVSPSASAALSPDPAQLRNRFSAAYQVAVAARTVHEVGRLLELAEAAGKPLPTLTVDTEVRFATPRARDAFADELFAAVTSLVAKYDAAAEGSRAYRLSLTSHPIYRADADTGASPSSPSERE
jgi:DNA-binding transcriptional ArsR family regulator